jgi:hypothetical protein
MFKQNIVKQRQYLRKFRGRNSSLELSQFNPSFARSTKTFCKTPLIPPVFQLAYGYKIKDALATSITALND